MLAVAMLVDRQDAVVVDTSHDFKEALVRLFDVIVPVRPISVPPSGILLGEEGFCQFAEEVHAYNGDDAPAGQHWVWRRLARPAAPCAGSLAAASCGRWPCPRGG